MAGALGSLDIELNANIANLETSFKKASQVADENMAKVAKAIAQTDKASAQTQAALDKLMKSLGTSPSDAAFRTVTKAANDSSHAMEEMGFKTAGAKREILVLAHELSQGNFSRAAGSMMVLGERTGAAGLLFSAAGVGALALGAAVAAVAYQAYQGYEAWTKLNDALKTSGNFAGQTTSQLSEMAVHIVSSSGDIGMAKEALAGLAASGRISGDQLASFGHVAVDMAKDTGTSIDEVVKSLAGMADGALKWAEEYNKQHHFMSGAQYELIASLDKEGKQAQATMEIINALQDAHTRMYDKSSQQIGTLARLWEGTKNLFANSAAGWASLGATATDEEKYNAALMRRQGLETQLASAEKYHAADRVKNLQTWLEANQKEIDGLRAVQNQTEANAKAQQAIAKSGTNATAVAHYLDAGTHSKAEQHDIDRQKENKAYQETIADLDKNSKQYEEVTKHHYDNLLNIDENYRSKKVAPKDDPSSINLAASLKLQDMLIGQEKKQMDEREAFIKESVAKEYITKAQGFKDISQLISENFTQTQAQYAKEAAAVRAHQATLDSSTNKRGIAEDSKTLVEIEEKRAAAEQEAANAAIKAGSARLGIQNDFNRATDEWVKKEAEANEQQEFAISLIGKSTLEIEKLTAARKIELDVQKSVKALMKEDPGADASRMVNAGADQTKKSNDLIQQQFNTQQSGWYGAQQAVQKYGESAANTGAQIQSSMTKAFGGAEDALAQFLMHGKMSFKSLLMGIESDLAHMASKSILSSIFGGGGSQGAGGGSSGIFGGLFGGGGSGGLLGSLISGGVGLMQGFGSFATMNAGVASSTGLSIADLAGAFAGGGDPPVGQVSLVGENGPELFVPRAAGTIIPNGQFGNGGSASGTVHYNPVIHIDSRTDQAQIHQLVSKSVAQGNADLVDHLQRSGKI